MYKYPTWVIFCSYYILKIFWCPNEFATMLFIVIIDNCKNKTKTSRWKKCVNKLKKEIESAYVFQREGRDTMP